MSGANRGGVSGGADNGVLGNLVDSITKSGQLQKPLTPLYQAVELPTPPKWSNYTMQY